jgi:hypothetical protein
MRPTGSVFLLLSLGLASCGGAGESNLFQPGHDSGADVGTEDVRASDGEGRDTTPPPDVAPMDVTPPMDTSPPPPKDTGPPDTGPKFPPIFCGTSTCEAMTEDCCVGPKSAPGHMCQSAGDYKTCLASGSTPVFCSEAADCPGQICCGTKPSPYAFGYSYVSCDNTCESTNNTKIVFCNPTVMPDTCMPFGLSCSPSSLLTGFSVCQ